MIRASEIRASGVALAALAAGLEETPVMRLPAPVEPRVPVACRLPLSLPALCLLASATLLGMPVVAQEAPQAPPSGFELFSETVDVDVVNVEVFVTDRKGNSVTGLTRSDFKLTVDGKEVPITNFYSEVLGQPIAEGGVAPLAGGLDGDSFAPAPVEQRLHLVVYVDNAYIRPANRKRVFQSLRDFLEKSLTNDDLVTVASFRQSTFTHSDFLNDRRTLGVILDELEQVAGQELGGEIERRLMFSEMSREETTEVARGQLDDALRDVDRTYNRDQILSRIQAYANTEYNRARSSIGSLTAYVDSLAGVPGRKAILHVSDGVANKPGEDLYLAWQELFEGGPSEGQYFQDVGQFDLLPHFAELARRANAARVTFYTLDAEPDHAAVVRSSVTEGYIPMRTLDAIEANYREPLESAALATGGRRIYASPTLDRQLSAVSTDFGTFYSLGFQAVGAETKKSHRIDVSLVKDKAKGLAVRHRESYSRRNRDERMASATIAALLYNSVDNPLGVAVEPATGEKRQDGRWVVPVKLQIPVGKLTFLENGGVHAARLSLFVTIKDERGNARPVQHLPFNLDIPAEFIDKARSDSARYVLPVVVSPGDQQVAIGVRDEIGAVSSALRIELPRNFQGKV